MKETANPYFNGPLSVRMGAIEIHSHAMSLIQECLPPNVRMKNLGLFNSFFAHQSMLMKDAHGQINETLTDLVKEEFDELGDHAEGK